MQPLSLVKLKQFARLQTKAEREVAGLFLAEGLKLAKEAHAAGWPIEATVVSSGFLAENPLFKFPTTPLFTCADRDFARLATQPTPEGILTILQLPAYQPDSLVNGSAFVLYRLQDPGNLGTILRTAWWFGHQDIYLSADSVDAFSPKVVRASMGAIFHIHIHILEDVEGWLASRTDRIWAASTSGTLLQRVNLTERNLILLGNESNGLPESYLSLPGIRQISIGGAAGAESLNVGIAAGILAHALFTAGR